MQQVFMFHWDAINNKTLLNLLPFSGETRQKAFMNNFPLQFNVKSDQRKKNASHQMTNLLSERMWVEEKKGTDREKYNFYGTRSID